MLTSNCSIISIVSWVWPLAQQPRFLNPVTSVGVHLCGAGANHGLGLFIVFIFDKETQERKEFQLGYAF